MSKLLCNDEAPHTVPFLTAVKISRMASRPHLIWPHCLAGILIIRRAGSLARLMLALSLPVLLATPICGSAQSVRPLPDRDASSYQWPLIRAQREASEWGTLHDGQLDKGIQIASLRPEPVEPPNKPKDDEEQIWAVTKSANTVTAYDFYLRNLPLGRHADAARRARDNLLSSTPWQPVAGSNIKDCANCPDLVVIPNGSFTMGGAVPGNTPQHRVNITSFAIGTTEVTQAQWRAVMGTNPSLFRSCGDDCPVENISWNDVQQYLQKLNSLTGKIYRLPSEAEWEYACRGAGSHAYCGSDDLDQVAWHNTNSRQTTHPVAGKLANAFGVFDMSGNVLEWTADHWHETYYGAPNDGSAWITGGDLPFRVVRGGSFAYPSWVHQSSMRIKYAANSSGTWSDLIGFRVARTLGKP